jgi:hypothetical protein
LNHFLIKNFGAIVLPDQFCDNLLQILRKSLIASQGSLTWLRIPYLPLELFSRGRCKKKTGFSFIYDLPEAALVCNITAIRTLLFSNNCVKVCDLLLLKQKISSSLFLLLFRRLMQVTAKDIFAQRLRPSVWDGCMDGYSLIFGCDKQMVIIVV